MEHEIDSTFKAFGKCLLLGGYAVLYDEQPGLVLRSENHWFEATASESSNHSESDNKTGVVSIEVSTPQYPEPNSYVIRIAQSTQQTAANSQPTHKVAVVEASGNRFVDCAVEFAFRVFGHTDWSGIYGKKIVVVVKQSAGFVKDEYTLVEGEDIRFTKPVNMVEKTGMGSSSCLTAAITGSLIKLLANKFQAGSLSNDPESQLSLINKIAQIAHSVAQGKIGSGFDVSCAVYGTQIFRRIPASEIQLYQDKFKEEAGVDLFTHILQETPDKSRIIPFTLPPDTHLLMLEYSSGTDTRLSVKSVSSYLEQHPTEQKEFLAASERAVLETAKLLRTLTDSESASTDMCVLKQTCVDYRRLMKGLGQKAGVHIEPDLASSILDRVAALDSVLFACCPGAGGYDALAVVVRAESPQDLAKFQSQIMAAAISIKEPLDGLKFLTPSQCDN